MSQVLTVSGPVATSGKATTIYNPTLATDSLAYAPTGAGFKPTYPRWMYSATLGRQQVNSPAEEAALSASDPSWSPQDNFATSQFQHFPSPEAGPTQVVTTIVSTAFRSVQVSGGTSNILSSTSVGSTVGNVQVQGKILSLGTNLLSGTTDFTCSVWTTFNGASINASTNTLTLPAGAFGSFRQIPAAGFQATTTYTLSWLLSKGTCPKARLVYFDGTNNNLGSDITLTTTPTVYTFSFTTTTIGAGALVAVCSDAANDGGTVIVGQPKLELGSSYTGPIDVACPSAPAGKLPTKIVGAWHWAYNPPTLGALRTNASQYNYASWVVVVGTGSGGGSVRMDTTVSTSDITTWKNSGRAIVALVGGSNANGLVLKTASDVTQFVSTFSNVIDQTGISGIDWDLEGNSDGGNEQWVPSLMASATSQLISRYGSNFIVACSPRPFEVRSSGGNYMQFITSLGIANLDLVSPQWYSQAGQSDSFFINSYIIPDLQAMTGTLAIPASKILIGCSNGAAGDGAPSWPTTYATAYSTALSQGMAVRGAINWHDNEDMNQSYTFASTLGHTVLGL